MAEALVASEGSGGSGSPQGVPSAKEIHDWKPDQLSRELRACEILLKAPLNARTPEKTTLLRSFRRALVKGTNRHKASLQGTLRALCVGSVSQTSFLCVDVSRQFMRPLSAPCSVFAQVTNREAANARQTAREKRRAAAIHDQELRAMKEARNQVTQKANACIQEKLWYEARLHLEQMAMAYQGQTNPPELLPFGRGSPNRWNAGSHTEQKLYKVHQVRRYMSSLLPFSRALSFSVQSAESMAPVVIDHAEGLAPVVIDQAANVVAQNQEQHTCLVACVYLEGMALAYEACGIVPTEVVPFGRGGGGVTYADRHSDRKLSKLQQSQGRRRRAHIYRSLRAPTSYGPHLGPWQRGTIRRLYSPRRQRLRLGRPVHLPSWLAGWQGRLQQLEHHASSRESESSEKPQRMERQKPNEHPDVSLCPCFRSGVSCLL